ncbi:MAG: ABC transporter permease [Streptomycetaceae bacterium]|nr:ABC transporter permease [Streptomycetaceae bacterium]
MPREAFTADAAPAAGVTPDASRIHDIGYRHYGGVRLARGYVRRSLYIQSLRGAYGLGRSAKSKILPMILFAVMCLPASIIVAVTVYTHLSKLPLEYTRYAIDLQTVIGLFTAAQAPQAVSRDLRFKTVPLYFCRPMERIDYVIAKYGAMASALFILTGVPLVILYVGALLAKLDLATQTAGFGKGLLAAALLSLLFGGIGLVIAALTPRRGFGVAAVIAVLILSYATVSSVQAVAYGQGHTGAISWLGLFSPITLIDGVQSWWLGATSSFVSGYGPPNAAVGVLYLLVVLGLIAGSFALLMRRYRKVGLG